MSAADLIRYVSVGTYRLAEPVTVTLDGTGYEVTMIRLVNHLSLAPDRAGAWTSVEGWCAPTWHRLPDELATLVTPSSDATRTP